MTRMRPVAEDSDEESVEEETDLAIYRRQKLKDQPKRHSNQKRKSDTHKEK